MAANRSSYTTEQKGHAGPTPYSVTTDLMQHSVPTEAVKPEGSTEKVQPMPRTDAAICRYTGGEPVTFPAGIESVVPLSFARQLERELADCRLAIRKLEHKWLAAHSATAPLKMPSMDEIQLACGELTAGEKRTVRAVLGWFIRRVASSNASGAIDGRAK